MSYAGEVIADTPLGYWRLGENSGAPQDTSGNARHLTVTGTLSRDSDGPLLGPGENDGSISGFSSTAPNYLTIPSTAQPDFTTDFTMELWVKFTGVSAANPFAIAGGNSTSSTPLSAINTNNGKLGFFIRNTANTSSRNPLTVADYNDGLWHHAVFVRTSTQYEFYVDGALALTDTLVTGAIGINSFKIGLRQSATLTNALTTGSVAQVAVYNYALSSGRVSAHYAARSPYMDANLSISGASSLISAASMQMLGAMTLTGQGSLASNAEMRMLGATTLAGQSNLSANAQLWMLGATSLAGQGNLTSAAALRMLGALVLSGHGDLVAVGALLIPNPYIKLPTTAELVAPAHDATINAPETAALVDLRDITAAIAPKMTDVTFDYDGNG